MLSGLAQSDRRADLDAKIAEWLVQEKNLVEMAHYEQFVPEFDPVLLQKVLLLGIKKEDDNIVAHVLSAGARRYSEARDGMIETIFMPEIDFLTAKRDSRWINLVWFIKRDRTFLRDLNAERKRFFAALSICRQSTRMPNSCSATSRSSIRKRYRFLRRALEVWGVRRMGRRRAVSRRSFPVLPKKQEMAGWLDDPDAKGTRIRRKLRASPRSPDCRGAKAKRGEHRNAQTDVWRYRFRWRNVTSGSTTFEIFVVDRKGQSASLPVSKDDYLETLREFIDFVNRQVGVYMDALAGFAETRRASSFKLRGSCAERSSGRTPMA